MRVSRLQWSAVVGLLLCSALTVAFASDFPPLTGRVVDQADVMTAESRSDIEAKSKELEDKSGIQLVVATVQSLQGSDIETYANELFRFWRLGQAQKNNGVLLLVGPAEHKVRIEVGYGLEGTLIDALSSVVISSAIIPHFKADDFSGGIVRGVDGIVSILSGDTADWQPMVGVRTDDRSGIGLFAILFFIFIFTIIIAGIVKNAHSGRYIKRSGRMVFVPATGGSPSSSSWSSDESSSSSSDDFSGGGGSSGGGGASGSW